jgi:hypothetical protein
MVKSVRNWTKQSSKSAVTGLGLVLLLGLATACQHQPDSRTPVSVRDVAGDDALFGRRARIEYPQFVAEVSYISAGELRWKTTAPDGTVAEGIETPLYRRLSENQHFLSWIERDGFTVSQVIDTKKLRVIGFGSYSDETSQRGRRTGTLLEGKIAFVK